MVLDSNAELIASIWEVTVSVKEGGLSVVIAKDRAASVKTSGAAVD